ncbi:DUF5060 domain-containing protein [Anthocerotibacter panamensis]|uniref:DUF5060 domain-containing protein n=1 Tax=Anthocerotibacter panamensis TaxID=2857077 RepID=UPI001C4066B7|nr:DUF5060 domain-containing protein [Anthocerotibacter panamensis]
MAVAAANLTQGMETAQEFGVHEIVLTGQGSARNPFDTAATVTFTDAVGQKVTVNAFYDGSNTWRARLYVDRPGLWSWQSRSPTNSGLNAKSGRFTAVVSKLRGMLREDPANHKQWATDDGRWFLNLNDTAYRFFNRGATQWQPYADSLIAKGLTSLRAGALGGINWGKNASGSTFQSNNPWVDERDYSRIDLAKFQTTDSRLTWLLNNRPDFYIQMILFGLKQYGSDATGQAWAAVPQAQRTQLLQYMVARWAAFPQIYWLIINDANYGSSFPKNNAMAQEIGTYFLKNDPWQHPLSTGRTRNQPFPFPTAPWASYFHLEGAYALGADEINAYRNYPAHVFYGEDQYERSENGKAPANPQYFYRWLFWSWLFAGGSANYGGPGIQRDSITPYSQVNPPLVGLNSIPYIKRFLESRNLALSDFTPADTKVTDLDGRSGRLRPKLMLQRAPRPAYLVYHPNARSSGQGAQVNSDLTAQMRVDLTSTPGTFAVEWYRAQDGAALSQGTVKGGQSVQLTAPWKGVDVVLYLRAE